MNEMQNKPHKIDQSKLHYEMGATSVMIEEYKTHKSTA